jgi:hypothetical protein
MRRVPAGRCTPPEYAPPKEGPHEMAITVLLPVIMAKLLKTLLYSRELLSVTTILFVTASQPGPIPKYKVDAIFEIQRTEGLLPDQIRLYLMPA